MVECRTPRGWGFETYLRCVVSLSKTLYSVITEKVVDWDIKPQHKQNR